MHGGAARWGIPLTLLATVSVCGSPAPESEPAIEISADELQRAYVEDDRAARARFEGRDLLIVGEVALGEPRFRGTTMRGEMEVPARITFRTALDTLPGDLDRVQVEGRFDPPDGSEPWALDPRIRPGETVRVSCPAATIRWTDPAVYVAECRLAAD